MRCYSFFKYVRLRHRNTSSFTIQILAKISGDAIKKFHQPLFPNMAMQTLFVTKQT